MATPKAIVTNIGTCRIAEPLSAAKRLKSIKRSIHNIYGFIHTSKEALQQIAFLDGQLLPDELAPYICSKGSFPQWQKMPPSDIYFVEISSTKEIRFDQILLQLNYLDTAFSDRPELTKTFFRLYRESDKDKRIAELAQIPAFMEASALEQRILTDGYVHQTTFEELRSDMIEIVRRLPGQAVFVNHINVLGNDGAPIASRAKLCEWLKQISASCGYLLYDPTPLVIEYGRERALEDGGRDVNHYTTAFKEYYGKALVGEFCEPKGRSRLFGAPPSLAAERSVEVSMADADEPAEKSVQEPGSAMVLSKIDISNMIAGISAALKLGEIEEASRISAMLEGVDPHSYKTVSMIAKTKLKAKDFHGAAVWLERATPLAQDATIPLYELVRCYTKLRMPDKLIETIDRLFLLEGKSLDLLIAKRDALLKISDYGAVAQLALELTKRDPAVAYPVAVTLASHGEFKEAAMIIAACRQEGFAGAEEPELISKLVKGLSRVAKQVMESGDPLHAAACWRAMLLLEPEHSHAASRIAKITASEISRAKELQLASDTQGAVAAYRRALAYDPDDIRVLRSLARCYDQLQLQNESAQVWERLGILGFERDFSFRRAARFAARAGHVTGALQNYGKMSLESRDTDTNAAVGSLIRKAAKAMRLAFDGGNVSEGVQNARAILEADPTHADALRLLRSTQVELARQSMDELPSVERLLARKMVGEIHVVLREAEQRAVMLMAPAEPANQAA